MRINRLALLTCAAISLSGAAFADTQTGPHAGGPGFLKSADTNKDGFVSADELKAFGDKMHAEWAQKHPDANAQPQDGARGDRMAQHILERVDADHDGKISKAEFDAEGSAMFKRLDKNGDGKIASDEMPQHRWGRFAGRMFDRMDTNGDGQVTKAEFTAAEDKRFQKLDKNGDGIIEKDEMPMGHHGMAPDGNAPDGKAPNGQPPLPAPGTAPDQAPTP